MTLPMKRSGTAILLLLGLCVECTPILVPPPSKSKLRLPYIVGGQLSDSFGAAGLLSIGDATCSGTLIAPDKVLTAAHCVDGKDLSEMNFALGSDPENSSISSGVTSAQTAPDFDLKTYANDIAVVNLSHPITEVEPAEISFGDANQLVGQKSLLVGYGVDDPNNVGTAGIRREAEVTVTGIDGDDTEYKFEGEGHCFGDSGGPAVSQVNGKWQVVGVASSETPDDDGSHCLGHGQYTRIDMHWPWLKLLGVSPTGREQHCGADGKCDGSCASDPDCDPLYAKQPGQGETPYVAPNSTGHCGDGSCRAEEKEDCTSCVADCGKCLACGDGSCNYNPAPGETIENCKNCPQDCGQCAVCGDGSCWENMGGKDGETCASCPQDCCPSDNSGSGDFGSDDFDSGDFDSSSSYSQRSWMPASDACAGPRRMEGAHSLLETPSSLGLQPSR